MRSEGWSENSRDLAVRCLMKEGQEEVCQLFAVYGKSRVSAEDGMGAASEGSCRASARDLHCFEAP